jgi:hypothetical protein
MMEIVFSYASERCPPCSSRLKSYRVDRRKVKCAVGEFNALHRIMILYILLASSDSMNWPGIRVHDLEDNSS